MDDASGGHGMDPQWWEDRYRSLRGARVYPPNPHLLAAASDLSPGTALDAGCGEGSETIWLAERGWRVTALDVSQTALDRARERVEGLGPKVAGRVTWVRSELGIWPVPAAGLDLVCSHYAHPTGSPAQMVEQLAAAVAPGGTLLVVGHQHTDGHDHAPAPSRGDSAGHARDGHGAEVAGGPAAGTPFTPATVTGVLDPSGWDVLVAEHRSREVEGHEGAGRTLQDAVVVARRRSSAGPVRRTAGRHRGLVAGRVTPLAR